MATYLNPGTLRFDAVVTRSDVQGSSAYVAIPDDLRAQFGGRGRVPVNATFDGEPYRGSLITMRGSWLLLVLQQTLASLGKSPGDAVRVTIELDTAERVVELADDIEAGLRETGQYDAFRALAYSHQRQFVLWVDDARRPQTRTTRIAKTAEMVAEGTTRN